MIKGKITIFYPKLSKKEKEKILKKDEDSIYDKISYLRLIYHYRVLIAIELGNSSFVFVSLVDKNKDTNSFSFRNFSQAYYGTIDKSKIGDLPTHKVNYTTVIKFLKGKELPFQPENIYEFVIENNDRLKEFLVTLAKGFIDTSIAKIMERIVTDIR